MTVKILASCIRDGRMARHAGIDGLRTFDLYVRGTQLFSLDSLLNEGAADSSEDRLHKTSQWLRIYRDTAY